MKKICGKCKENIELKYFDKNKRTKDGYSYYCKSCMQKYRNYDNTIKLYRNKITIIEEEIQKLRERYRECKYTYIQWKKKTKYLRKVSCKRLSTKQKEIIKRKIDGESLSQIGEDHGLSKERVRQIVNKALLWDLYHNDRRENGD
jgi:hypothetical protein